MRRQRRGWVTGACLVLLLNGFGASAAEPEWKVGLAQVKITPERPVLMSGYAGRTKPFEKVAADPMPLRFSAARRGRLPKTAGNRAAPARRRTRHNALIYKQLPPIRTGNCNGIGGGPFFRAPFRFLLAPGPLGSR